MRGPIFADRRDAGARLARVLRDRVPENAAVLALPRSGVPIAYEVAAALKLSLDVLIISAPNGPDGAEALEQTERARREHIYRGYRPAVDVVGRTVVLIDDGLTSSRTMQLAIDTARTLGADEVIVGVPVGSMSLCEEIALAADGLCCLIRPDHVDIVGAWYRSFTATTDEEVRELLADTSAR